MKKQKPKKKKNKKQLIADILTMIILIAGILIIAYPSISNYLYIKSSSKVIDTYNKSIDTNEVEMKKKFNNAIIYNHGLITDEEITDPFSTPKETDEIYEKQLDVNGSGMMGTIDIPKINMEAPIYHGTKEVVLQAGIGHLYGTSLPVGGNSTHSVLTGHRGLPNKKLFTELDQIEEGDRFYLKILGNKIAYQVDQILTVLPTETSALGIVKDMDYCTLVTCTPYGVNSHRLLIRGERIPYSEEDYQKDKLKGKMNILFELAILALGILAIIIFMYIYKKRQKRKVDENGKK